MDALMISLPIFTSLKVERYGLYPGTHDKPGLSMQLAGGLTLVLGANGLGKTTLVTLLYRLCTGPYDVPGFTGSRTLGGKNRRATKLKRREARTFAARVADGAIDAEATIEFTLGDGHFLVRRSLADLSLLSLNTPQQSNDLSESRFQEQIRRYAGVPAFSDWILLLRYLTFYLEDRRALVWDASAQRQMLRLLFLPASKASRWATLERDILELDSRVRNLQSALSREEATAAETEVALESESSLRAELDTLSELQVADDERHTALTTELSDLEADLQLARLDALRAEQTHENSYRDLERLELQALEAAFPTHTETARYLLTRLLVDDQCQACGNVGTGVARGFNKRIEEGRCVVCGLPFTSEEASNVSTPALARARVRVDKASERQDAAKRQRDELEGDYSGALDRLQALSTQMRERRARMDAIIRRLPPDQAAIQDQRSELLALRNRVTFMKRDVSTLRAEFGDFLNELNVSLAAISGSLKEAFEDFARGFLLEDASLAWAPVKDRVGETGIKVTYPGFALDLPGSDFPSAVRRATPSDVSESQREFIDLAFRMALITIATPNGSGSLVIDAPESSLDAVFVRRAANVLSRFTAKSSLNRLVVTSNLIEGDLIPALVGTSGIRSATDHRVVDLLRIAAPTAAVAELYDEYETVRHDVFEKAKGT